jgi:hypothetical protein
MVGDEPNWGTMTMGGSIGFGVDGATGVMLNETGFEVGFFGGAGATKGIIIGWNPPD